MKKSIEKKYAVIFSLLIAIVIIVCWCANALFLSKYYVSRKMSDIESAYVQLDKALQEYGVESSEFKTIFESNVEAFNCDILILDQNMNVIASNVADVPKMSERLLHSIFGKKDDTSSKVVEKKENYTLQTTTDIESGSDYLELWGVMSAGSPIFISIPVVGITDDAGRANIFLAYIGIIAIIISYFVVKIITKSVTKPILEMVDISDKMANLDFDTKYVGHEENEIGLLGEHMNKLSGTLEKTISELKSANISLEAELKKRTEMDAMRNDFLSSVSHELKTPIALILGYAEGLLDCVNDDEESKNFYCEVISDEAKKMNKLVKNLLELNELEFGVSTPGIERFDIRELIDNHIQSLDILIKQNDIDVFVTGEKPLYVWSDEFMIEQVFANYMSNAIHYVSGDRKEIRVSLKKHDNKARISVFNSGNPIDEDVILHIWTKFYKADKARVREYGGNGVGLSIVKATMESLNQDYGVINCKHGVEFYFEVDLN